MERHADEEARRHRPHQPLRHVPPQGGQPAPLRGETNGPGLEQLLPARIIQRNPVGALACTRSERRNSGCSVSGSRNAVQMVKASAIVGNYLRGQLLISGIAAFNVSVALILLDMPLALVIGLLAGLLNMIPNIGIILTNIVGITIAGFAVLLAACGSDAILLSEDLTPEAAAADVQASAGGDFELRIGEVAARIRAEHEDPAGAVMHGLCEAPTFYEARSDLLAELVGQRQVSRGLSGVISAPVNLYHHQVDTVARVLADPVMRYLLADEVGLGKTIEACLVVREVAKADSLSRILIVCPPG